MRSSCRVLLILTLLAAGCQPVDRYTPPSTPVVKREQPKPPPQPPEPIDPEVGWRLPNPFERRPDLPIEFVHAETDRDEWLNLERLNAVARLPNRQWFLPPLFQPGPAATLVSLPDWSRAAAGYAVGGLPVKIKVPLGLDDPRRFLTPDKRHLIPADNPLTLAKWRLGRRLFYDKSYLNAKGSLSCAGCHLPDNGYTDGQPGVDGLNTPTLLNCVYNAHQFWDGRATYLEEVVQRTLEDERDSDKDAPFHHVWGGVIRRLTENVRYRREFEEVFGVRTPTQDAVGKAIATFLRTLLCGNSLHDRARAEQARRKGTSLEPGDYEKVLDPAAIKALGREGQTVVRVGAELHDGYRLFHNLARKKANCVLCHEGSTFSDNGFHNLGVGVTEAQPVPPPARFAWLPVGLKQQHLFGAFKTPTLRSLERTGPYMHNGEQSQLEAVVKFHAQGGVWNVYLDPLLLEPGNFNEKRNLHLDEDDVKALTVFLRSLNGQDVDPVFKTPRPVEE